MLVAVLTFIAFVFFGTLIAGIAIVLQAKRRMKKCPLHASLKGA